MNRNVIGDEIAGAVETVIVRGTNLIPFVRPDRAEIFKRVNDLSGDTLLLRQPADLFDERLSIGTLDQVAKDHIRNAQVIATTSGGATGLIGLPGLALDLPILVACTVGMVRRHALTYGFTEIEDADGDRLPLLLAFGAAMGADAAIDRIAVRVGTSLTSRTTQRLLARAVSEEMAATLTTRWLTRAVPLISSAASAALNWMFLREAGKRSMTHYRSRNLLVRQQNERKV